MPSATYVLDSASAQAFASLEQAAHEAATSPWNKRKPPTRAQMLQANWKHGHFWLRPGLHVKIENPRGTIRSGKTPDGIPWENRMAAHYGDIVGTRGADGDPVDIFVGPHPESPHVWVINQRQNWKGARGFDEHKVMTGFYTEEQARAAYLGSYQRGWDGLESIVPCTYAQLKWWLRSGDCTAPFTTENLPHEGITIMDNAVLWDQDAQPVGIPMHQLIYALRRQDAGDNLLLDSVTMADLMTDPDIEGLVTLDALVVEVSRMSVKMDMLKRVMESAGSTVKPTEVTISDPVRARGVLQVMVLFQMDDGQTVAIWFHNPDTTPAKLTPLDDLVSWKWMLNKKDVTIVVAPEHGQELNIREVARRIMRLVERNSDTFKRANEKAAARTKEVEELKTEITVLEVELSDWQRKIEVAQLERDEAPTPKERWDSAKGHANAIVRTLKEELMEASLTARSPAASEAYNSALNVLMLANKFATGEQAAESPEELRTLIDKSAVEVRSLMEEAARAPARAQAADPEPAPASASAAGSSDAALAALITPDDLAAIRFDGGYLVVRDDERLALKWQDVLDSAWQQRIVDVRNALRGHGWRDDGNGDLAKNGHKLVFVPKQVGAGRNVVGGHWEIQGVTGFFMSDLLEHSAEHMAVRIDMGLPKANSDPAADEPGYHYIIMADGEGRDGKGARGRYGSLQMVKDALDSMDNGGGNFYAVDTRTGDIIWSFKAETAILAANGRAPEPEVEVKLLDDVRRWANKERDQYGWKWMVRNMPKWITLRTGISLPNAEELLRKWAGNENLPTEAPLTTEESMAALKARADEEAAAAAAAAAADTPKSPTDAELEAAAEAGAEVKSIARNLADPATKDMVPRAHLRTEDGSISVALWTDKDVTRAVKAVADAEEMSNFRPFDPSTLKMPTAVQLGLNRHVAGIIVPVSDKDPSVVLDGWSNGHMMDLIQRPPLVLKAIEKYYGDLTARAVRRLPMSKIEAVESRARGRSTQVEPISHYDYEQVNTDPKAKPKGNNALAYTQVNSVVLSAKDGDAWVALDVKYLAYFWKTYKGCEFFADGPMESVAVRHHGKLVGVIMPMNFKGDTSVLARAKRVTAQKEAAKNPDELSAASVDAAYQFAEATEAFKIAIAHSVGETSYSPFLSARSMDERANAHGLTIAWDIQSVVLDAVPGPGFSLGSTLQAFDGKRERILDAVADAARPYLPAGAVLDFAGDVTAAITQLEIALDTSTNNEPIWRREGNIPQADLCARNIVEISNALRFLKAGGQVLDDINSDAGGEEWETVVGTIKRNGEVIGRAVVADGDGKAMVYVGASGTQRVTFVSPVDGERRTPMWSDDDAGEMIDWLVENIAAAEAQAAAAIAAAAAPAPEPAPVEVTAGGGQPPADPPATPPVAAEPEPEPVDPKVQAARDRAAAGHVSELMGRAALAEISAFMPRAQRKAIESGMRGEEAQYFFDKMWELRELIANMPKLYEQDGKGGQAVAYLHYFQGGADWYITERDFDLEEQQQAYGQADLGHGPEMGYVSIEELTQNGVELDLHFKPTTLDAIRGVTVDPVDKLPQDEEDQNIGRTWRSPSGLMEVTGFKDGRYTTQVDGEKPGLSIDPDDLEQTIRDDERAVAETETGAVNAHQKDEAQRAAVLAALVANHGWTQETVGFVSRVIGGGGTGGMVNPNGDRRVIASVSGPVVSVKHGDTPLVVRMIAVGEDPAVIAADVDAQVSAQDPRSGGKDPNADIPELIAAGFTRIGSHGQEYAKSAQVSETTTLRFNVRRVGGGGYPAGWTVRRSATFNNGVTGAPSEDLGRFETVGEAVALVQSELDKRMPPAAAPAPAPEPTAPTSAGSAEDRAYLQSFIDGTADMTDEGHLPRMEAIAAKYEGDAEMQAMLEKAALAWSEATAAMAKQALGG